MRNRSTFQIVAQTWGIAVLAAILAASCVEDPSVLSLGSEDAGALMEIYERYEIEYGVRIKNEFAASDFGPVNIGYELPYTPTQHVEGIMQLLQYLEENVFSYFPSEFLNEYMPRTILLVDSLNKVFEYSDTYNSPKVEWSEHRPVAGYVTDLYLVLGNASARFDPNAEDLKEELISLLVERLLCNSDRLPLLTDFVNATEDALRACKVTWQMQIGSKLSFMPMNYPYWDGLSSSLFKEWNMQHASYTRWKGWGLLKPGRLGYVGFYDEIIVGIHLTEYAYDKGTVAKDFGDFTAFVLTKTAAEKEAFYAAVAAADSLPLIDSSRVETDPELVVERNGVYYDRRFPLYGGQVGADAIRAKVAIVKAWWQQAGITLKEPE
jgi:hypothetical protein